MARQTSPKIAKIKKCRRVGQIRRPIAPPSNGNSKNPTTDFLALNHSTKRTRDNNPSLLYLVRIVRQIWPKSTSGQGVCSGHHVPYTPRSTPGILYICRLGLICLRYPVHSSNAAPNPRARGPRKLCEIFFWKFVQLWGAIAPNRGRNSKIWEGTF